MAINTDGYDKRKFERAKEEYKRIRDLLVTEVETMEKRIEEIPGLLRNLKDEASKLKEQMLQNDQTSRALEHEFQGIRSSLAGKRRELDEIKRQEEQEMREQRRAA